jgi:hypothetical protein
MPSGNGTGYHPGICCQSVFAWVEFKRDEASILKHRKLVIPIHDPPRKFCVFIEGDGGF